MPRRKGAFYFLGCALGTAFGLVDPMGRARTMGVARELSGVCLAGHSHRLTSGGKAEPDMTLEAKQLLFMFHRSLWTFTS